MKTYVLILSEYFPKDHPKAGEPTGFVGDLMFTGKKIHTIRSNYELWAKRIDEVRAGKARLSIRIWTGKTV